MSDQYPTPPVPGQAVPAQPQYVQPVAAQQQYNQPTYGQPPYGQPTPGAPEPRKKSFVARHKVLTTFLALVVLIIVVAIASSSGGSGGTDAGGATGAHASTKAAAGAKKADESAKKPAKKAPGIGDPVRDGKFQFTVTKVDKPVKRVGSAFLSDRAQGEFVKIHLTIKNIGDKAQTFVDSAQELRDAKGRQFDADTSADIDIDNANSFLEDINPGNAVKGVVVFDVPKGTKVTSIELHDSIFSGGTSVALS